MTDIHIHAPVVHIHVDQSRVDAEHVARTIRRVLAAQDRHPDVGEEGEPEDGR